MIYLLAILTAPVVGVLLYRGLHGHARLRRLVDGFVYVAVPALVGVQVLPHAWEERSAVLVLAVGAGALIPTLLERASRALAHRTDDLGLLVAFSGLALHTMLEGAAFAPLGAPVDRSFAWAVILHRVPVGLVIWWLVRPRYGVPKAALGIVSLVVLTLLGFVIGNEMLDPVHGPGFELYQAFVAGTLLHVVFHQGRHDHAHDEHDEERGHGGARESAHDQPEKGSARHGH